jgi:hypothetical protein
MQCFCPTNIAYIKAYITRVKQLFLNKLKIYVSKVIEETDKYSTFKDL